MATRDNTISSNLPTDKEAEKADTKLKIHSANKFKRQRFSYEEQVLILQYRTLDEYQREHFMNVLSPFLKLIKASGHQPPKLRLVKNELSTVNGESS